MLVKYHPLVQQTSGLGYKRHYLLLMFGSLGHVHKRVIRGVACYFMNGFI